MRPFRRGLPAPLLVVLAVLIVVTVVTHFPLFLIGFAVFWFVVLRHCGPRRVARAAGDGSAVEQLVEPREAAQRQLLERRRSLARDQCLERSATSAGRSSRR